MTILPFETKLTRIQERSTFLDLCEARRRLEAEWDAKIDAGVCPSVAESAQTAALIEEADRLIGEAHDRGMRPR